MRYQTKQDRINELRASICGETGIFIDLVTVIDKSSKEERPCNYTIYHGQVREYDTETIDPNTMEYKKKLTVLSSHYIDGWDSSKYENGKWINKPEHGEIYGLMSLNDVERFISLEIAKLHDNAIKASLNYPSYKYDETHVDKWENILEAWRIFQKRFLDAKEKGRLIDVSSAKEQAKTLFN